MLIFNAILAMFMGAAISLYLPMVAQSSRIMGHPAMGNVPFFGIAFLTSIVLALGSGVRPSDFARTAEVPAWLFLAGVVSALMILGSVYLIPRIGTGALFVLMVTGQILLGVIINQFGLLGVPVQPMTLLKGLGVLLVITGAGLVTFGGK